MNDADQSARVSTLIKQLGSISSVAALCALLKRELEEAEETGYWRGYVDGNKWGPQ